MVEIHIKCSHSLEHLIDVSWCCNIQYIPGNMHTVFALLCFVVVIHWLIFPYPSGLLHWHCGNLTIAPVPAKQPWWIWIKTSCEFIMNDCITTTKQSTTKPCAYFLGYTVYPQAQIMCRHNDVRYQTDISQALTLISHLCVLSMGPVRYQAITSNNDDLLSIGPIGTLNFSEISIKIFKSPPKNTKRRPSNAGLHVSSI